MSHYLDVLRDAAAEAGKFALNAAYLAGKETEKLADRVRMHFRASQLENQVGEEMEVLGGFLYATHTGRPTDSDLLHEKMKEIDRLKAELADLRAQLGQADTEESEEEE
ncbi:MAG: hypothetical protein HFG00_04625 [Oscillibacter sp.]|nr:hypothetical protein [Oscillibacter sp.]